MKGTSTFFLLAGALLLAFHAQAQTMYRCGSVYQDRPCEAGKAGRAVGSTGTAAPAARTAGVDAECVQRGKDSLKIVWSREGGATQERMLSEATSAVQRRLVQDVWRRPGAATQVQAAVEADCVAEKEKAERDAAFALAAALKAQREGSLPAPAATSSTPAADPEAAERRRQEQMARAADEKKARCVRLSGEMDRLRARERSGGSARTMDELNEQRRSLRDEMSKAGC